MDVYDFTPGSAPLLISIPHAGTEVPEGIGAKFTDAARSLPDTDWYVHELYDFARDLGATIIKANYSRYVIDLNRAPDSRALYATHTTTPLCPTHTFSGAPIYRSGSEPDQAEIERRREQFWQPYHNRIRSELERILERHGAALLWDAHSIASEIPSLFEGVLPEFNFGTRDGASCPPAIAGALLEIVTTDGRFDAVLDGRFKGGYITQHYGRAADRVYAVQLELAQRAYMNEAACSWDAERAAPARALIARVLERYLQSIPR
ncbi:MAG TPA: N-formylglutamate deformylase [Steroidobacter sp.]